MITLQNFKDLLRKIGFTENNEVFSKEYAHYEHFELRVDFKTKQIIYPSPITLGDTTTSNFEHPENFVVLECVTRLLDKGYRPEHIGLEKRWQLGRGTSGGKADICVTDENNDMLFIVECKTAGKEYIDEYKKMCEYGGQLFSYLQQERSTKWLVLYASDMRDNNVHYDLTIIKCTDDANILKMAEKDKSVLTFAKARSVEELYEVWDETYNKATQNDIIFAVDNVAYNIGEKQLRKKDLKDFTPNDKIVNRFEEILRHNNVSDKENAFNRLIALFICKLVDEIKKGDEDIVDFQYKVGTDTYESLQDRLQYLHKVGMQEFMQEDINYIDDGYADRVFGQLEQGKRKKAIEDLRNTLRILKYYTNNDFAFKDVHNEELFYQNGKVLVEVVQLFEKYRIVYPSKHQFLGDLFEQLLNKGFKQNEGQFFTPMPITRFIWDSLPLEKILHTAEGYRFPKVIDYACGAGHFLTEAVESVNAYFHNHGADNQIEDNAWVEKNIFGIEKDYRLARVAKVSLYMNGAGKGQIVFGDGLEQYSEKGITNNSFDILVANPPYSVDAFKAHLKLRNNSLNILSLISNSGSEIETAFVERIAQLLRPCGVAAVLLPSSILNNDSETYEAARKQIFEHFTLRAIVQLGSKTFGATSTTTVILFLEKYIEPPKRKDQVIDSVDAILSNHISEEWEERDILDAYLKRIDVSEEDYKAILQRKYSIENLKGIEYFLGYINKYEDAIRKAFAKKKSFASLSIEAKEAKILDALYHQILEIEKDKLYYFALVYKQNTLIITSPTSNDEQKKFLGYEWSNRRGKEGIQISTPGGMLYNDLDRKAGDTLAAAVRCAYNEVQPVISEKEEYFVVAKLQDMIEFTRPIFNKAIKTAPEKKIIIKSKYPLVKLGSIVTVQKGQSITRAETKEGNIKVVAGGTSYAYTHNIANREANTITISASGANAGFVNIWREPIFASDCTTIKGKNDVETLYIYNFLQSIQDQIYYLQRGAAQPHVYPEDVAEIPIPFVTEEIMQQIVSACTEVDEEYNNSRKIADKYRRKIAQVFENQQMKGVGKKRVSELLLEIKGNQTKIAREDIIKEGRYPVITQETDKIIAGYTNLEEPITDLPLVVFGDHSCSFKYVDYPFVRGADGTQLMKFNPELVYPQYMCYMLSNTTIYNQGKYERHYKYLKEMMVVVPSLIDQQKIIDEVDKYVEEIQKAEENIMQCAQRKKDILGKYLS